MHRELARKTMIEPVYSEKDVGPALAENLAGHGDAPLCAAPVHGHAQKLRARWRCPRNAAQDYLCTGAIGLETLEVDRRLRVPPPLAGNGAHRIECGHSCLRHFAKTLHLTAPFQRAGNREHTPDE